MSRVWEESSKGEGPRIITPGIYGSTTTSSISTDVASTNWGDQLDIPWSIFQSPSNNTKTSNSPSQVPNVLSNEIAGPATIPLQPPIVPANSYNTSTIPWLIQKSPSSHSPLQTSTTTLSTSTSTARPFTTVRPTERPTTTSSITKIRPTTRPSSTTIRPTSTTQQVTSKISIHPVHSANTTSTRLSSTTVRPTTTTKKPTTRLATSSPSSTNNNKTTTRVSTTSTIRPSSTTSRPQTKQQSTTTRKSGTTVPKTTKSPILNVPNSNSKTAENVAQPSASHYDVELAIDEAITYITSQLEELKRRSAGIKKSSKSNKQMI